MESKELKDISLKYYRKPVKVKVKAGAFHKKELTGILEERIWDNDSITCIRVKLPKDEITIAAKDIIEIKSL